jgi:NADH-quinone oxidoreductase subunit C
MDPETLVASLQESVSGAQIERVPSLDRQTTIYVAQDAATAILRALRDRPDLAFNFLAELTAVDLWPKEPRFELIYILVSIGTRQRVRVKVRLHGTDPRIATACGLWPAANWLEREVWDLFGIAFDGHPDPRRLLMPEDWEGFPLRKDYPVQIHMKPRSDEALQVTAEEFRANIMKDRLTREPHGH